MTKEWLDERFNEGTSTSDKNANQEDDDSDHDSLFSIDSNDTLHNFINFQSHRNNTGLEEAVSFTYPFEIHLKNEKDDTPPPPLAHDKNIRLSTLLEEDDLVPIFDGAGWAGTRVWAAAIWAIKYLVEEYSQSHHLSDDEDKSKNRVKSLCELGCGLGVPGMIWHQMGGDVVLSDQQRIMSQLTQNVRSNFEETFILPSSTVDDNMSNTSNSCNPMSTIQVEALDWSYEGYQSLLQNTGFESKGFDILLNCDCVYEPLYGKSWEKLVEVIDACLEHNPKCVVVTSVERRLSDGIDKFVQTMKECESVGSVEKILEDRNRKLELYITTGKL